jgi:hypothetical protein
VTHDSTGEVRVIEATFAENRFVQLTAGEITDNRRILEVYRSEQL